jgi:hypothetical protein
MYPQMSNKIKTDTKNIRLPIDLIEKLQDKYPYNNLTQIIITALTDKLNS